jgi:hypothetical protein
MKNPWDEISVPKNSVNAKLCQEGPHPLKLYFGRDTSGQYLFIYNLAPENLPEEKSLAKLEGIEIRTVKENGLGRVILLLSDKSDWEIFHDLCVNLIDATAKAKSEKEGAAIILGRLNRWQEFLKLKKSRILTPEKIKGLLGELLFLKDQMGPEFGWDAAIKSWKGPEKAPQDFAINEIAVEIKCQSGSTRPTVKINSAEQLEPQLSEGYLVVFTLAESSDQSGFDLNEIVGSIRSKTATCDAETRQRFEDLIVQAGYVFSDEYTKHKYTFVSAACYRIDEGFPRIKKSELHEGVESTSYIISLDACEPFKNKPDWWTYE